MYVCVYIYIIIIYMYAGVVAIARQSNPANNQSYSHTVGNILDVSYKSLNLYCTKICFRMFYKTIMLMIV